MDVGVSNGTGKCAYCPPLLFNNINGICVLKDCYLRERNNSARWVCGSNDCVYNGNGCGASCLPDSFPDGQGICSDPNSSCGQKVPLPVENNKCGEGCVYIGEENRCSNSCPQFFINDSSSGICVGLSCDERVPNTTLSSDYCGPNCVQISSTLCGEVCPPSTVLDLVTKQCGADVDCSSYQFNASATFKCGEDCAYDPEGRICTNGCGKFYERNSTNGICSPVECGERTPSSSASAVCGPYPCFQTNTTCVVSCPQGQAADSKGVCAYATQYDVVAVNSMQSLDDALNTKLNKNSLNPLLNITGSSFLNNNADAAGVSISGSNGNPVVIVPGSSTLSLLYTASNGYKPTSLYGFQFNITTPIISSPLIKGAGTSSSTVIVNTITFLYGSSLGAELLSFSDFGSVQFSNVSVVRTSSSLNMLSNADDDNICGSVTNGPALLLRNSNGMIGSSTFQNIDTGWFSWFMSK